MIKEEALKKYYEALRMNRYSPKSIDAYTDDVRQYITFIAAHQNGTRDERIGKFLTRLVVEKNVSATTQKQYLCAIVTFYRLVFGEEVGKLIYKPSSRAKRPPVVLSCEEAWRILDNLTGESWLWGAFMYGCGLRLDEVCNLRVKDVDLDRKQVSVRDGKGGKDRIVPLPDLIVEPMRTRLRILEREHASYFSRRIPVWLPDALDRKYPSAPFSWEWFWLFPATGPVQNKSKNPALHSATPLLMHIHHSAIQKRIGRAIRAAKVPKKAHCHTLRHSFATHWLENAEGSHEVAIVRLQKLLGHSDATTTMLYLHCVKQRTDVPSPLDVPLRKAA